ncbi:hypothetical protein CG740_37125 [Streptomyces sp. CB01201]|uniref:hypothetical protein n=1 Tax=Streptomyces sp. CB01201 TaxID=2020324 RepID=UPI000C27D163|nr:hypothetical protein [Streptomyces sp. CB01201]PJM98110.1 hypothetical protein CG740_37125 [Streptomyces sp. CB01201]
MDISSLAIGAELGAALTLVSYNLAVIAGQRARRRDQIVANRELKKMNADLFLIDFKAERLRIWMRSAR